jgi:hypothetical protein
METYEKVKLRAFLIMVTVTALREAHLWPFAMGFFCAPVEVRSNTSTVSLRVIGGDEKGTQCLGV